MMFCIKCGSQMADDAIFCDACGYEAKEEIEQSPVNQEENQPEEQLQAGNVVEKEIPELVIPAPVQQAQPVQQTAVGINNQPYVYQPPVSNQMPVNTKPSANVQMPVNTQQNQGQPANNMYQHPTSMQFRQPVKPAPKPNPYFDQPTDSRKAYCVLSYIGILWIFGLCISPEKYDDRVRFNAGQGMLLTVISVAINIVVMIINTVVGAVSGLFMGIFGQTMYNSSPPVMVILFQWGLILCAAAFVIVFMVLGILNVVKDKDKPLPLIGKFAFYK